jgi:hypothetical protein
MITLGVGLICIKYDRMEIYDGVKIGKTITLVPLTSKLGVIKKTDKPIKPRKPKKN